MINRFISVKRYKLNVLALAIFSSINGTADHYEIKKDYHYQYDKNGNNTFINKELYHSDDSASDAKISYVYNIMNQLIEYDNGSINYVYAYYPDGKRYSKTAINGKTFETIQFFYNYKGQLLNEAYSKNNILQKISSYFYGLRFIEPASGVVQAENQLQFLLLSQHNHPAAIIINQGQSSQQSYHLTGFGQLEQANIHVDKAQNNLKVLDFSLLDFNHNPMVYGSGYYDSESALEYMGARYYSAEAQRFIAQDSYNLLNRYNYADANPVMNYDPDGHKSWFKKAMSSKAFNYGSNGFGVVAGIGNIVGLMMTPEINIPVKIAMAGSALGSISGLLGLSAQIAKDGFHEDSNQLEKISMIAGTVGGMLDIASASYGYWHAYSAWQKNPMRYYAFTSKTSFCRINFTNNTKYFKSFLAKLFGRNAANIKEAEHIIEGSRRLEVSFNDMDELNDFMAKDNTGKRIFLNNKLDINLDEGVVINAKFFGMVFDKKNNPKVAAQVTIVGSGERDLHYTTPSSPSFSRK